MYTLMFVFVMVVLATTNTLGQTIDGKWEIVYKLDIKTQNGFGTTCYFHGIKSPNKKDIIAIANINVDSPHIITSNDSGRTWTLTHHDKLTGTYNGDLYRPFKSNELSVPDTNLAIIVCDSGYYWRSTNNGKTWINHIMENRKRIWRVDFWDNQTGIIFQTNSLGIEQVIQKTIDGGKSWKKVLDSVIFDSGVIVNMHLLDSLNGIAACINFVMRTSDGGETWYSDPAYKYSQFSSNIEHVLMLDKFTAIGLAFDKNGEIYRYSEDSTTKVIEKAEYGFNVHPNPAGNFLNIEIPDGFDETTEFSIFTLNGEEMKYGSLSPQIDISQLHTGVYYLIIKHGQKVHKSKFMKN